MFHFKDEVIRDTVNVEPRPSFKKKIFFGFFTAHGLLLKGYNFRHETGV